MTCRVSRWATSLPAGTRAADRRSASSAEEVQRHFVESVTHVPLGEWTGVYAVRSNIETRAVPAPVTAFWGITKK